MQLKYLKRSYLVAIFKDLQVTRLEVVVPETPRTPPHNSLWKPVGEMAFMAFTPLLLPSGIVTYMKGHTLAAGAVLVVSAVSSWKVSGVVAEFCCHWILQ